LVARCIHSPFTYKASNCLNINHVLLCTFPWVAGSLFYLCETLYHMCDTCPWLLARKALISVD